MKISGVMQFQALSASRMNLIREYLRYQTEVRATLPSVPIFPVWLQNGILWTVLRVCSR